MAKYKVLKEFPIAEVPQAVDSIVELPAATAEALVMDGVIELYHETKAPENTGGGSPNLPPEKPIGNDAGKSPKFDAPPVAPAATPKKETVKKEWAGNHTVNK